MCGVSSGYEFGLGAPHGLVPAVSLKSDIRLVDTGDRIDGKKVYCIEGEETITDLNAPTVNQLGGMQKIKWNGTTEIELDNDVSNEDWYDYENKMWANGKLNGSYYVYIPRYAYKILDNQQKVDVKFITKDNELLDGSNLPAGYKVHPAFTDGSATHYTNGEWDTEISGIWVAKYEMSETATNIVSVPGQSSLRGLSISDMYIASKDVNPLYSSHLVKNSEWGAVAYLAQSQYGLNDTEIETNVSSGYYTGGGYGTSYKTNLGQSTTGNIYGIYDMSGGAAEYVSSYLYYNKMPYANILNESMNRQYGTEFTTVYNCDTSGASDPKKNYNYNSSRYGQAIWETSEEGYENTSWYNDYSVFPNNYPLVPNMAFLTRGGNYANGDNAGLFCFSSFVGNGDSTISFRVTLCPLS